MHLGIFRCVNSTFELMLFKETKMTRGMFMTCCWLFSSGDLSLFLFLLCMNILTCFCQTPVLTNVWSCRHLSAQQSHACAPRRYHGRTSPIVNIFHDTFILFMWWEEPGQHELCSFLFSLGLQTEQLCQPNSDCLSLLCDSELESNIISRFWIWEKQLSTFFLLSS